MEPHQQTEDSQAPKPAKSLRTYMFEFALLFTAVVLGFLADHLREQYSEHRQEMEYLKSFYEDLKTDSEHISRIIAHEEERVQILDAIPFCYDSVARDPSSNSCLAKLVRNSMVTTPFIITERTLQQLMSGGFRLLEKEDTDSIMDYISIYRNLEDHQETVYQESQVALRDSQNELIDFKAFSQIASLRVPQNDAHFLLDGVSILKNKDPQSINRFFNEMHKYKVVTLAHVLQLKRMKSTQEKLIRYFQRKHSFV